MQDGYANILFSEAYLNARIRDVDSICTNGVWGAAYGFVLTIVEPLVKGILL